MMNSLQKPSPGANRAPTLDAKSLSFDEVSTFFSVPLSDAADSLGVCTSALKKICYENGLVRWPYRKFLTGKSIEEIKKDAVTEKTKQLRDLSRIAGESTVQEMSKSRNSPQTKSQGSKNLESGSRISSNVIKQSPASVDEFKYGFPSDGLSTISYRWWGNSSPHGNERTQVCDSEYPIEKEQESGFDGEESGKELQKSSSNAPGASSLFALRRRAVKEGKAALKLRVYRGYGINKLDRTKRSVLTQIFKSSLASPWEYGAS